MLFASVVNVGRVTVNFGLEKFAFDFKVSPLCYFIEVEFLDLRLNTFIE